MKKYKNAYLSLASYVIATLWFSYLGYTEYKSSINSTPTFFTGKIMFAAVIIFIILVLMGIRLGFKSNKIKESSWVGKSLAAFGILVLTLYLLIMTGFFGY